MPPLRAGISGLGWAGTVHARVIQSLPGVELAAVADPDPQQRSRFPGILAVARTEDLLNAGLDYCVVASPTADHQAAGLALAAAGIHAIIEKPLAASLPAALALAEAFGRAGLTAAANHTERNNPAIRAVARLLQDGDLGPVYHISTRRQGPFPGRVRDVGVVTDLAIHDVDLATWLTGAQITSVTASVSYLSGRPHEDLATAICQLTGGLAASHQVNWVSPLKERLLIVHAQGGCLVADALTGTVTRYPNTAAARRSADGGFPGVAAGQPDTWQPPGAEPFEVTHTAFRDALLGRPPATQLVSLAEAAAAVAAVEAILTAARAGTAVSVTSPQPAQPVPAGSYGGRERGQPC
jgi:predicted dehydrogenase